MVAYRALAASGHVSAAPPSSVMNSRRFTWSLHRSSRGVRVMHVTNRGYRAACHSHAADSCS
jgi:hypothetical protein